MLSLEDNYRKIRSEIDPKITLIIATKTQPIDRIETLYRLGHRDFGENYVQELCQKAAQLELQGYKDIRWHFIGHLQSNKIKLLLPYVYCIHTMDSEKLTVELVKQIAKSQRKSVPVFIEVNVDDELNKYGIPIEGAENLARFIHSYSELSLQGLMCIPATGLPPGPRFAKLRELEKKCQPYTLGKLSMGMSDDYRIAIQEGSTHIRVGTALFGERR